MNNLRIFVLRNIIQILAKIIGNKILVVNKII